jgi:hypothetical protein
LLLGGREGRLELGVDGKHGRDDDARHQDSGDCDEGLAVTGVSHVDSCLPLFARFDSLRPAGVGHGPLVRSN